MPRLGLRARVSTTVAVGALVLSTAIATLSYQFIRSSLLDERRIVVWRTAYYDASYVEARIGAPDTDYVQVLSSFNPGRGRTPVLVVAGTPYRLDVAGVDIPRDLAEMVEGGQAARQIVHTPQGPVMIIGIPLATTQYYEIVSLRELDNNLRQIGLVLTLVAGGVTLAAAALGWYTGRRALRPLASVAEAAEGIAAGDLNARLDPQAEPDLERLAASFNNMVDQLQQRIERDRRFAADVSHELRSPLQTLAAAAAVLERRQESLDARTADAARLVVEEVDRFQQLVTDLLEITRAESELDLSEVDVLALARDQCKRREIDPDVVTVLNREGDATWRADARRVEQILGNLLENAQRHGGGVVAVRLYQEGGYNVIEVDDDGPGVLPENRELIFRPFVRGSNAERRGDTDGAGLGLAIVARLAESHGGRATVLDRPGGGARFRVELGRQS